MTAAAAAATCALDSLLERFEATGDGGDVAVVVAHPDDETIGVGGHLDRLPRAMALHVTDGAPRDLVDAREAGLASAGAYAAARRRELERAMAEAGIPADRLRCLGIADQQAPRHMAGIARRLALLLRRAGSRLVLTHPFEGGHPDHDATAYAVHAACRMISGTGSEPPAVVEMAFYHAGPQGPVLQDFAREPSSPQVVLHLSPGDLARKRRMLAAHATQCRTLMPFTATEERFRAAPAYDFRSLPNGGRLLYEALPVHFTGTDWQRCVAEAASILGENAP